MDLALWRNVAIILLALEGFIMLLIPGALFFLAIKGLRLLEGKLLEISPKVQGVFRTANQTARQVSDKAASPFIAASAANAQVRAIVRKTTSLYRR